MNLKVSNAGFARSEGKRKNNANTNSDVKKNAKINYEKKLFGNKPTHGNWKT